MENNKKTASETPAFGRRFIEKPVKSAIPIWAAAVVWIVAALILPFYKLPVLILTALISASAAVITAKMLPKETVRVEVPFTSGNADVDATVAEINRVTDAIDACRIKISDIKPETADTILGIEETAGRIRADIAEHPEDLRKIRRFINYYLPTTVNLCEKYVFITGQDNSSEKVTAAASSIESALSQLKVSYDHLYDSLFENDFLDVSADLTVLEAMMERDNLK